MTSNQFHITMKNLILLGLLIFVIALPVGYATAVMYNGLLIALLGWLIPVIRERRLNWRRTPLDAPILLFLFFALTSTLLSPDIKLSLSRFWKLVQAILLFYLIVNSRLHVKSGVGMHGSTPAEDNHGVGYVAYNYAPRLLDNKRLILVATLLITGSLTSVIGLVNYLTRTRLSYDGRLLSTFKHHNDLAAYLVLALPLGLGCLLASLRKRDLWKQRILLFFGVSAMTSNLIFSFTRGAWIAVFFALIVLAVFHEKRLLWALMVFALISPFVMPKAVKARFTTIIHHQQGFMGDRPYWWRASVQMIKEHPLTGIGPGRFEDEYAKRQPEGSVEIPQHAHNTFLNIAAEMGLPTLLSVLWLCLQLFLALRAQKQWKSENPWDAGFTIGGISALASLFVYSLVDNCFHRRTLLFFWFLVGLLLEER